jgi:arylamine N-acetyltransferase
METNRRDRAHGSVMFMSRVVADGLVDAYLDRLGLEAEPPSAEALRRLHRRQVERVPYETLWIHAGESWGVDPVQAMTRIALHGRGGYCYHLNGAFGLLLRSLGYSVEGHVGAVHGADGPNAESTANHLVLTVAGLPADDNPSGRWYVDAGLGDAMYEPLPLAAGVYRQEPFRLVLEEPRDERGDWHLTHDPSGGFVGMYWTTAAAELGDFEARHHWLSTAPESGFVQLPMAERRDATGIDVIRGLVLSRIGSNARSHEPLTERDDWFAALADMFHLRFEHSPSGACDRLWSRVVDRHRAWEASGRP